MIYSNYKRILACMENIEVNLFLEESRLELNLEHKWRNPVSEEEMYERERELAKIKKGNYNKLEL
jgi:hypothetical protein